LVPLVALLGTHFLSLHELVGILYLILQTVITIHAKILQKYCLANSVPRKGVRATNDRQKLVFANFGLTMRKQ
jgi:hypothetical protein